MGVVTATWGDVIVREGPFTREQLDALPDDGYRHELLDGVLLMTPSPNTRHQDIVGRLYLLLTRHAPRHAKVLIAPFDVALGERTVLEPDVVVARRSDVTEKDLPGPPLLAIEVISPSTRLFDLGRKRDLLEEAGCPSYWVVDPTGPELTAWDLRDGAYVEVARVGPHQAWTTDTPFLLTLVPGDLLDD
jgi:Uma2 family endonuclease